MNLRFWRRPAPAPALGPSKSAIAVLEYDLYGVPPEPGTMAAALINLRALSPNYQPGPLDLAGDQVVVDLP